MGANPTGTQIICITVLFHGRPAFCHIESNGSNQQQQQKIKAQHAHLRRKALRNKNCTVFWQHRNHTYTHTQTHIEYYTSHEYIERFCSFQFSSYAFPHSFWFVDFPQRRKRKSCWIVPAARLLAAGVSFGFSFSPPRVCVCVWSFWIYWSEIE